VSAEWLTEAVSSVDPTSLKDATAIALLDHMRKHFNISPQSTSSTSANPGVSPKSAETPSKNSATDRRSPPPPPTDLLSTQRKSSTLDTKEKCIATFHEVFRVCYYLVPQNGLLSVTVL